ncbi:MAG: type II toxin-antitoxin system RelE/ParE family toxin [Bryocella sp.]
MIVSFKHRGLEHFFRTGAKAGIQPAHTKKLRRILTYLNVAKEIGAMDIPGWDLHPLKGELSGHWSVRVNGNWRITFRFTFENAEIVDYRDYH